jgi:uncharacterized Zn finger protein
MDPHNRVGRCLQCDQTTMHWNDATATVRCLNCGAVHPAWDDVSPPPASEAPGPASA